VAPLLMLAGVGECLLCRVFARPDPGFSMGTPVADTCSVSSSSSPQPVYGTNLSTSILTAPRRHRAPRRPPSLAFHELAPPAGQVERRAVQQLSRDGRRRLTLIGGERFHGTQPQVVILLICRGGCLSGTRGAATGEDERGSRDHGKQTATAYE
jgi:hypothetical protein